MKKQDVLIDAITNLFLKIDDKKNILSLIERKELKENVSDYNKMVTEMFAIIQKGHEVMDDEESERGELIGLRVRMLNVIWHYEQLIEGCMKLLYKKNKT